jgi:hypothetical protein
MSGPKGVISVGTNYLHTYHCEVECCKHAMVVVIVEGKALITENVMIPDSSSGLFKPRKNVKKICLDPDPSRERALIHAMVIDPGEGGRTPPEDTT